MREVLRKSRALRRVVRWYRSRTAADPGWDAILRRDAVEWRAARERARGGPRVLLATSLGGYSAGTTLESLLAVALTLRGADVQVLLCDGILPACQACEARAFSSLERFARTGPQGSLCAGCFDPEKKLFEGLGLKVHRFGEHITAEEGEHAMAGALRFFARGDISGERSAEPILRRYLHAAILTTFVYRAEELMHTRPAAAEAVVRAR